MEERIAELNRQSMEARGKLLQLIEQQKLIGLNLSSPPVSPIPSPLRAWTGWSQILDLKARHMRVSFHFLDFELKEYIYMFKCLQFYIERNRPESHQFYIERKRSKSQNK